MLRPALLAAASSFAIALAACSAGVDDPATGGSGGAAAASGSGSTATGFEVGGGPSCMENHCSSDLHSFVDCDGNVLMTCPPDQGCTPTGGCAAACDAAIANKTNIGCEYYAVVPDVSFDGAGACFAAFVANTWTTPITLTVDYGGTPLDPNQFAYLPSGEGKNIQYTPIANSQIPPGAVAILFLNSTTTMKGFVPPNKACPAGINPAILGTDAANHGTVLGKSFHITTSAPVVSYDMYPYGGGDTAITSATLLLPTSAWDTNYIAMDAFGSGPPPFNAPFVQFVASADDTSLTINPTADIAAGTGVAGTTTGVPQTYTLSKGQVLQFTQAASLAGSVVLSDKPIAAWAGQQSFGVEACCDETAHQQIPPIRSFGSEYALVKYRDRYDAHPESPPWGLVGAVDGTVLTWEPSAPPGAPTTLARGQVARFDGPGPYVVRSQDGDHPFYVSSYMTGGGLYDPQSADMNATPDGRGDAEFVNVVPPGEFLDKYTFFTDPTYPETDLVVVRTKGPSGFADVTLDCAGALGGWQPVGTSGRYEYTRIDLVRHDFQPQGGCDNGRHEMSSSLPFGLTVWGWGSAETGQSGGAGFYSQYVSYAYPAGAGVQPINSVVVPPVPQ
jgi:hypothetical protein